jgi:hypothetical protein
MARLRVHNFSVSLDGFGAGPSQNRDTPLGVGGEARHEWQVPTHSFRKRHGDKGGAPIPSKARATKSSSTPVVPRGYPAPTHRHVKPERLAVRQVREYLHDNYAEDVTLDELAGLVNLSPFHLNRVVPDGNRSSSSCLSDAGARDAQQVVAGTGYGDR